MQLIGSETAVVFVVLQRARYAPTVIVSRLLALAKGYRQRCLRCAGEAHSALICGVKVRPNSSTGDYF